MKGGAEWLLVILGTTRQKVLFPRLWSPLNCVGGGAVRAGFLGSMGWGFATLVSGGAGLVLFLWTMECTFSALWGGWAGRVCFLYTTWCYFLALLGAGACITFLFTSDKGYFIAFMGGQTGSVRFFSTPKRRNLSCLADVNHGRCYHIPLFGGRVMRCVHWLDGGGERMIGVPAVVARGGAP